MNINQYDMPSVASCLFGAQFSSDSEGDGPPMTRHASASAKPSRQLTPTKKVLENRLRLNERKESSSKSGVSLRNEAMVNTVASVAEGAVADAAFEVESIVEMRVDADGRLEFAVKWALFPLGVDKWQPAVSLFEGTPKLVADYLCSCDVPVYTKVAKIVSSEIKDGQQFFGVVSGRRTTSMNAAKAVFLYPTKVGLFIRKVCSVDDGARDDAYNLNLQDFMGAGDIVPDDQADFFEADAVLEVNDHGIGGEVYAEEAAAVVDQSPDVAEEAAVIERQSSAAAAAVVLARQQLFFPNQQADPGSRQQVLPRQQAAHNGMGAQVSSSVTKLVSTVPKNVADINAILLPIILQAHIWSRPLARLPPTRFLSDDTKLAWRAAIVEFYQVLHVNIRKFKNTSDELLLLNMVLTFIQFPAMVLVNLTKLRKVQHESIVTLDGVIQSFVIPPHALSNGDDALPEYVQSNFVHECAAAKGCIAAVKSGRRKKGNKILTSFGVSGRNVSTRDALRRLIVKPNRDHESIDVTADIPFNKSQTAKQVRNSAMTIGSIDAYGWGADFLSLVVNVPGIGGSPSPLEIHAEFIGLLSQTSKVSDAVAWVMAAGVSTPLNKVPAKENIDRVNNGFAPVIRPVVGGTMPLKSVGSNLLNSSHGRKAMNTMANIQRGVSVKNGCDSTAHILRGAFLQKKMLLSLDAINAFNALFRQFILIAISVLWPEATPFFVKYYNLPVPLLYSYRDSGGTFHIDVNSCYEGVKQGDPPSSAAYSLTAHYFIYNPLSLAYPCVVTPSGSSYNIDKVAFIDDFTAIFDCPPVGASITEWHDWYIGVAGYMLKFDQVANPIGIFRNAAKDRCLVPSYAPSPPPPSDTFGIDLASIIRKDGIISVGSPIGTDEFMLEYANLKADYAIQKIDAVASLCPDEPQMALGIITDGGNASMDYLVRTTPTVPILGALERFDEHVMNITLGIICPPAVLATVTQRKLDIAKAIIRGSKRFNGFNLCPSAVKGPAAYLASTISSSGDVLFQKYYPALHDVVMQSVDRYAVLTGVDLTKPSPVSAILPINKSDLLSTKYTSRVFKIFHSRFGIMAVLINFFQQLRMQELRQSVVPPDGATVGSLSYQDKSDMVHVLATTSKSSAASIVSAELAIRSNRVEAASCRAFLCYWLNLPSCENGTVDPLSGAMILRCSKDDEVFDSTGNHASACSHCHQSRSMTHSNLRNVMVQYARAAGFISTSEPNTYNLVHNIFTSPDQLKVLFPKHNDATASLRRKALENQLEVISASPVNVRNAMVAEIANDNHGNGAPAADAVSRRADTLAVPGNGRGVSYWCDITSINCTTKGNVNKQADYHVKLQQKDHSIFHSTHALASRVMDSPAVLVAEKIKHKKYGLIETLANLQALGAGPSLPLKFIAAVITHRCEFSAEFINYIEACTGRYKNNLKLVPDIDGRTPAKAAMVFRSRFMLALCVQMARGFGHQLIATAAMSLSASVNF
jgi:hypothetical protein